VNTRRAPVTISALSATGAVAIAFAAWCGPVFASADVKAPSPELAAHTDTPLHEILSDDESESGTRQDDAGENEDLTVLTSDTPEMTTSLPGVSSSDSPRFRRQMYRTDI
jgi:hypothetical protein